jgi:hypothetical protein
VVVLNLAIEYIPAVISGGFTLTLLTAVLLKVAPEVVILLKAKVNDRLRAATTKRGKAAAALALWMVAAGSKPVVLELVDLVFGDAVSLGGFVPVTLLVVALLVSGPPYDACWTTHLLWPHQLPTMSLDDGSHRQPHGGELQPERRRVIAANVMALQDARVTCTRPQVTSITTLPRARPCPT